MPFAPRIRTIIEFEAKHTGRWNAHQHLVIVSDQVGERQADAPNVVLMGGPVPLQDWVQILEKGWGTGAVFDLRLSFMYRSQPGLG